MYTMSTEKKKHFSLFDFFIFFFLFFSVLGYSSIGKGLSVIKTVIQVLLITLEVRKIDFKKYVFIWPLIFSSVLFPLVFIITGIYRLYIYQNILFCFYMVFNLIFIVCVSNRYKNKVLKLVKIIYIALNTSLIVLLLVFRNLSFNIPYLISAMITNQRYGNDMLLHRYGMGFNNVNTLALFSSLLIMISLYYIVHDKHVVLCFCDILFSLLCIVNAESRTPFFVLFVILVYFIVLNIKIPEVRRFCESIIYLALLSMSCAFIYYLVSNSGSTSFESYIDNLSSYRLSFGINAMTILKNSGSLLFGVGPLSTKFITLKVFGNNFTLDNSFEHYLFTLGWLGFAFVYGFFIWIFVKIHKQGKLNDAHYVLILLMYYFTYSLFENIMFIPNSTVSNICLFIIIAYVANLKLDRK